MRRIADIRPATRAGRGSDFLGKRAQRRRSIGPASTSICHLFAIAAALAWASGLRLYAVVFLTGLAGHLGWVPLPAGLAVLEQPAMLWASGVLLGVEFLADKVPWVDSLWDTVHTVIRIPAGAALAASVFGGPAWATVAACGLHTGRCSAAKATTRAVNTRARHSPTWPCRWRDAWCPRAVAVVAVSSWFFALTVVLVVMLTATVLLFRYLRGLGRKLRGHFLPTQAGSEAR
jgi:hypothetical protein